MVLPQFLLPKCTQGKPNGAGKKMAIMAMPLPKMEKKNYVICERVKKKKGCHVHNIFTINYTWLIIISSKNLWQINCGNGVAEISEKNQVQLTRCKLKYNILILKWCKQKQKKKFGSSRSFMVKVIYETGPILSTLIMHVANQKEKEKNINSYVHAIKKQKVNQPITSTSHLIWFLFSPCNIFTYSSYHA